MNSVTHGVGAILCLLGAWALTGKCLASGRHRVPCAVYATSLCTLYLASTVYHSCFMLPRRVKDVLHFMDKTAIYLLIAGSYTPFLVVLFPDKPEWSVWLLSFVWAVALVGISAAFVIPTGNPVKPKVSLAMYLGMAYSGLLVMRDAHARLPDSALALVIGGGVAYTAGVPLFVRNRNLDHAMWHLFVLAGSALHFACIYFYLAEMP